MKKLLIGLSVLAVLVSATPSFAQSADVQTLSRELDRLRNDLVDLQRFVYAGQGEAIVVSPSIDSTADAAAFQLGIQQLEEKLRLLTGRVEDLEYQQRQLNERMDSLVADLDARLAAGAPLAGASNELVMPESDAGLTGDDLVAGTTTNEAEVTGALLPPGSEMDQYNFAFSLLRKADYDGAEIAFNQFITVYPDSELNGNAYYWLGSTYFVRDNFQNAAIAFLKGYQFDSTGPKAADNLLKLGVTLSRLGKNAEACATFAELTNKFPEAAQTLLDEAADEAASAGCG